MDAEVMTAAGRKCRIFRKQDPAFLLIQPIDAREGEETAREADLIAEMTGRHFLMAAFETKDWNRDLSPWPAPPAFGKEPFGGEAERTLSYVREELLPDLRSRYGLSETVPAVIGGYSLAGLFALWSVWRCRDFAAAAAASPSVWFPGWTGFAEASAPSARAVYLSLGDREERTKNRVMAAVGDCIRRTEKTLRERHGTPCVLEWNEGNHFREPDRRTARAFARCMDLLAKGEGKNG